MKLHELVAYLEQIDQLDLNDLRGRTQRGIDQLNHVITNNPAVRFKKINRFVIEHGHNIDKAFQVYSDTVEEIKRTCMEHIRPLQQQYLEESLYVWKEEMCKDTVDKILNRRMIADSESEARIIGMTQRWKNWQVPGVIIGPRRESWIDYMVDTDPLYLVDTDENLLVPARQRFNPVYDLRLRKITVQEVLNKPLLYMLPDNQIGYVFAYAYFNYKPLELIYQYLEEFWKKLRPGGAIFMTINDCDFAHGTALFEEQKFMCFTPGSWIVNHAESLGFKITDRYRGLGNLAWLELRKPGEMTSIRGGQTLARILPQ
jgi:hypothetical protein